MKKHYIYLSLLGLSLLFTSCSPANNSNTDINNDDDNNKDDNNNTNKDDDKNGGDIDITKGDGMSLFMYGDLYYQQMRSIYVKFDNQTTSGNIIWETSDESIIRVSEMDSVMPEALLTAMGYGEATITATLESDSSIKASKTIKIDDTGKYMPSDLYESLMYSMKLDVTESLINYDENYNTSVEQTYNLTTIFEENKDSHVDELTTNLTDAFQLIEKDNTTNATKDYTFVRSNGGQLAKERINLQNEVSYEILRLGDEGEETTVKFDSTYYTNPFGRDDLSTNEDWLTFDNGKTYHFVGGSYASNYFSAHLFLSSISPDDMILSFNEDSTIGIDVYIDPCIDSDNPTEKKKYGSEYHGTISELGKATIEHLKPFEHLAYHDNVEKSITNMKNLKNYSLTYTLDYETDDENDETYKFVYLEDTIDQIYIKNNGVSTHTGIHKKDDGSYYEYSYNESTKELLITEDHPNAKWEDMDKNLYRYPTFDFASEIFESTEKENTYISRTDNGGFIQYCAYLPSKMNYYDLDDDATITLTSDNNYIEKISSSISAFDEQLAFDATFSSFNETSLDIDFSTAKKPSTPTTWEEGVTSYLYQEMLGYNIVKYLPYLYIEEGYDSAAWNRNYTNGAYLETNEFETVEKQEQFIIDYQNLLVENGYTKSEEQDANNDNAYFYIKDGAKVSVAKELNWNNNYTMKVKIWVFADDIDVYGNVSSEDDY